MKLQAKQTFQEEKNIFWILIRQSHSKKYLNILKLKFLLFFLFAIDFVFPAKIRNQGKFVAFH